MAKKVSPFISLKYRDFKLLWIGSLISNIGSQMQVVAISWHIYTITHSPYSLALIGLARFLPLLIFSPIGGLIADSHDRKKLMLITQTVLTISTAMLAILTFINQINPFFIYFFLALSSIAFAADTPARQSLVPSLVPNKDLRNALSLNTIMFQSSIVIGPSIAGFIIAYLGTGTVYLLNSLSFVAVILALVLMQFTDKKRIKEVAFSLNSIKEGFVFVFRNPLISSTTLLDFFATFFSSATVLLPVFAKDILKVGPQGLGFLYAAPSIGSVLMGLIYSSFSQVKNQGKIVLASVLIYGIATIFFGISRSFYLSLFFLAVTGMGDSISTITRNTLRQLLTPDKMRGRMNAVSMIFYFGGPQLGEVEAGMAAGLLSAPISVITGGIGAILSTIIIAVTYPQLRRYQSHETELKNNV